MHNRIKLNWKVKKIQIFKQASGIVTKKIEQLVHYKNNMQHRLDLEMETIGNS